MKKMLVAMILASAILSSCDPDAAICYDCVNSSNGNTSKYCLPRSEAKDRRDALEADGYTCTRFRQ